MTRQTTCGPVYISICHVWEKWAKSHDSQWKVIHHWDWWDGPCAEEMQHSPLRKRNWLNDWWDAGKQNLLFSGYLLAGCCFKMLTLVHSRLILLGRRGDAANLRIWPPLCFCYSFSYNIPESVKASDVWFPNVVCWLSVGIVRRWGRGKIRKCTDLKNLVIISFIYHVLM